MTTIRDLDRKEVRFAMAWVDYLKEDQYEEYWKLSQDHVGWLHQYEGKTKRCPDLNKEDAFMKSMEYFHKELGIFGVDENNVTFEPLFRGYTLRELLNNK